jgi:tetratricopeptide (TPR) repeat protein
VDDNTLPARSANDIYAAACRAHQARRVGEAEALYRQVIEADPRHAQAWYLLGAACHTLGKTVEAADCVRRSLQERPDHADAQNLLGVILAQQGHFAEAAHCFRQALELRPDLPGAARNLELAHAQLDRLSGGMASMERAVRQRPADAGPRYQLGMALAKQNRVDEAATCFAEAVRLDPNHAEALGNLGTAHLLRDRAEQAAECFRRALQLRPDWTEAHNNLGVACLKTGRWDEAVASFGRAVDLRPQDANAMCNLGQALVRLDRLDEALDAFGRAIGLRPDVPDPHCYRGYALTVAGRHAEALASFETALRLRTDHADAHFERALVWLLLGDWQRGLPEYEWRFKTGRFPSTAFPPPQWDGSPLAGRTILLHPEQGFGDTLHFIRYAPLVKQLGGTVVVSCPDCLVPLLSRCGGIDRLVPSSGALPRCDVRTSLQSLPLRLGTTPANIPGNVPYLFADPALVERWRHELPPGPPLKVGIVWQGNPGYRRDNLRSIPLRHFAPLAQLEGVQLYSLQKGAGTEQLAEFAARYPITDVGRRLTEQAGAFTDTAAALMNLDLLIGPDTAVVHLAGGLGVPAYLALPAVPDWRWLLGRDDTPWYPTLRLFRQTERGNWEGVFERIGVAVRQRLTSDRTTPGRPAR